MGHAPQASLEPTSLDSLRFEPACGRATVGNTRERCQQYTVQATMFRYRVSLPIYSFFPSSNSCDRESIEICIAGRLSQGRL